MARTKEAKATFQKTMDLVPFTLKLFNLDVLSLNWTLNWRISIPLFNYVFYPLCIWLSMMGVMGDLLKVCFAIANMGYYLINLHRTFYWPLKAKEIKDLERVYVDIIDEWEPETVEGKAVLKNVRIFRKCTFSTCYYFVFTGVIVHVPVVLGYLFLGQRQLAFQYYLPVIDHVSSPGFELNFLFHLFETHISVVILFGNMALILMATSAILLQCDLLQIQIKKLDEILDLEFAEASSKPEDEPTRIRRERQREEGQKEQLLKIVKMHQRLDEYLGSSEDILGHQQFVDCLMISFSIIMVLFVEVVQWYPEGVPIVFVNLVILFVICVIGTISQSHLEALHDSLCSLCWYKMSQKNQKTLQLLILKAQEVERLTAGGFRPLNLNLFVAIMNKVYSYVMILKNLQVGV